MTNSKSYVREETKNDLLFSTSTFQKAVLKPEQIKNNSNPRILGVVPGSVSPLTAHVAWAGTLEPSEHQFSDLKSRTRCCGSCEDKLAKTGKMALQYVLCQVNPFTDKRKSGEEDRPR